MNKVQAIRKPKIKPPRFERTYIYILMVFLAFLSADLLTTYVREYMFPTKAPQVPMTTTQSTLPATPRGEYTVITNRNIFNSDGVIPDPLKNENQEQSPDSMPAELSQLPLGLVGTLVHVDPGKSIATIELKSKSKILPFQVGEEIEGMATVQKIERRKVFFKNLNNNRNEYIEIKEEMKIDFGKQKITTGGTGPIQRQGNEFEVNRAFVDKQLLNLPELLQTASGQFNFVNGRVDGYRILDIEPDSLFTQFGIQPGDVIKAVNGQPLDSPAKAMELFNELKNAKNLQLTIGRNGKDEDMSYTLK